MEHAARRGGQRVAGSCRNHLLSLVCGCSADFDFGFELRLLGLKWNRWLFGEGGRIPYNAGQVVLMR